jgi:hypothetical protein
MADLEIRLQADRTGQLKSVYRNAGKEPLALTFWWNRSMRVTDAQGRVVEPGPGPVLPCGVREEWLLLEPGASVERDEPLGCTQPAGRSEKIGWSYELAPGTYRVVLVHEAPPKHGFTQSARDPRAFTGRVESDEVTLVVAEPEKKPGFLARLFGS